MRQRQKCTTRLSNCVLTLAAVVICHTDAITYPSSGKNGFDETDELLGLFGSNTVHFRFYFIAKCTKCI